MNKEKIENPPLKWAKNMSRQFTKEEIQKANKCMKTCSKVLVLREMHIKRLGYLSPLRMEKKNQVWWYRNLHALLVVV